MILVKFGLMVLIMPVAEKNTHGRTSKNALIKNILPMHRLPTMSKNSASFE
jgi:hypothetical protein